MHELCARFITGTVLSICVIVGFMTLPPSVISVYIVLVLGYVLLVEWPRFSQWKLTPLYPVLPFTALIYINQWGARWELPWLCALVIAHDTGAYFIGRRYGRNKIWPQVSPKKSWEGCIGGITLSIAIIEYISYNIPELHKFQKALPLAFVLLILMLNGAGIAGDLFESWLKRKAHLKDSGSILPGHGGILDRLDSLLCASVVWVVLRLYLLY